jgi:hypothetical protein
VTAGAITAYLTGLVLCYFAGLKWGTAVKFIKDLGRSA